MQSETNIQNHRNLTLCKYQCSLRKSYREKGRCVKSCVCDNILDERKSAMARNESENLK